MKQITYFLSIAFLLSSCYRSTDSIDPKINYQVQEEHIQSLSSLFLPLDLEEKSTDWGREYAIGRAFAEKLDLYRAVSTFKRAEILVPSAYKTRKTEIQYDILLSYYLGGKYYDVIECFEAGDLTNVDKTFTGFHDLLVMLYSSYRTLEEEEKADRILEVVQNTYPETGEKLGLSTALLKGNLQEVEEYASHFTQTSYLDNMLDMYKSQKKSVGKAKFFNALFPGAGYWYIGQKRSAITSLVINTLFIYAAYQFFNKGHVAAGVITTSFEMGWYFGGIYGAGEEAKFYNEHIYERTVGNVIDNQGLHPVLMLQHSF